MGAWGTSLYSGDFAMDLRGTIAAISRLPFDGDRLAEILCASEPGPAEDSSNEDHTVFWLVAADQFAKRGIDSPRVREMALTIIDHGTDSAAAEKLGMKPPDLDKRQRSLTELRGRLVRLLPECAKPRKVLKKPQPFLFDAGDVLIYPTSGGRCINPYSSTIEKMSWWQHDGWGAMVIAERGRAFEFFSWYRPLTIAAARAEPPSIDALSTESPWFLRRPGTCSAVHYKRMRLEMIGNVRVHPEKLVEAFPRMPSGRSAAISDISIANQMSLRGNTQDPRSQGTSLALDAGQQPTIPTLAAVLG
jgi:hypothetical protein